MNQALNQIEITKVNGEMETIKEIVQFNFMGAFMVFDMADGKSYEVRPLTDIKSYIYKGMPVVRQGKSKRSR